MSHFWGRLVTCIGDLGGDLLEAREVHARKLADDVSAHVANFLYEVANVFNARADEILDSTAVTQKAPYQDYIPLCGYCVQNHYKFDSGEYALCDVCAITTPGRVLFTVNLSQAENTPE